jgi:hypothetical protein
VNSSGRARMYSRFSRIFCAFVFSGRMPLPIR